MALQLYINYENNNETEDDVQPFAQKSLMKWTAAKAIFRSSNKNKSKREVNHNQRVKEAYTIMKNIVEKCNQRDESVIYQEYIYTKRRKYS